MGTLSPYAFTTRHHKICIGPSLSRPAQKRLENQCESDEEVEDGEEEEEERKEGEQRRRMTEKERGEAVRTDGLPHPRSPHQHVEHIA